MVKALITVLLISIFQAAADAKVFDVIAFDDLENAKGLSGVFSESSAVIQMQEDINRPGSIIFVHGYSLQRYDPGVGISLIAGSTSEQGSLDGPALNARYRDILDLVQYNDSISVVEKYRNCVREYNSSTQSVRVFIGSCNGDDDFKPLKPGMKRSMKEDVFAQYPLSITYLKTKDQFFIPSRDTNIYVVDIKSQMVSVIAYLYVEYFLPSQEETLLFAAHYSGISVLNITTEKLEVVVDKDCYEKNLEQSYYFNETWEPEDTDFSNAHVGPVNRPAWIIPNHIMVAPSSKRQSLVLFDFVNKYVHFLCKGTKDLEKTVTGPPNACKINFPQSVFVSNNTIHVVTLDKDRNGSYSYHSNSLLFTMKFNVSKCMLKAPTDKEIFWPNASYYDIYSTVEVYCTPGYELVTSYSSITCIETENKTVVWDRNVPSCSDEYRVDSMMPTYGQMAGSQTTLFGLFPKERQISVKIVQPFNETYSRVYQASFKKEENVLLVNMPPTESSDSVDVTVEVNILLSNGSYATYILNYTYMKNPQLANHTASNIASGGVNGVFCLLNIESAHLYTLTTAEDSQKVPCQVSSSCAVCKLPECSAGAVNCSVDIYSDGVLINNGKIELSVLPNPSFDDNDSFYYLPYDSTAKKRLMLSGKNLNLGELNSNYKVSLEHPHFKPVECEVYLDDITDNVLPVDIQRDAEIVTSVNYTVNVTIGNFVARAGLVTFSFKKGPVHSISIENSSTAVTAGVVVPVVVLMVIVGVLLYMRRRKLKEYNKCKPVDVDDEMLSRVRDLLLDPDALSVSYKNPIGEGNFGLIFIGQLHVNGVNQKVAVKTIKASEVTSTLLEEFLSEAALLKNYQHPNVLSVIGINWSDGISPQLVLPYMANGELKAVLRRESLKLTLGDLLHFGKQVACGMEYLSAKNFIHRDLAARNCLVNEKFIVKIADFGLSRHLYSKNYYRINKKVDKALPVKWLSIESLNTGLFTSSSDVWSYGVVLWEICTRGSEPYADVDPWDLRAYLQEGNRLPCPSVASEVYDIMLMCWQENPEARPTFSWLHEFFSDLLNGIVLDPQSTYTYIRDYTNEIPDDYAMNPYVNIGDNTSIIADDYVINPYTDDDAGQCVTDCTTAV